MTGYREREIQRARAGLVEALAQLTLVCERPDADVGVRCWRAMGLCRTAARRLELAALALDPQFVAMSEEPA